MKLRLTELKDNEEAEIAEFDGGREFIEKISQLNLRIGKTVKKIVSEPFSGPVIILIDNTRVAIGRGLAKKIIVDR